MRKYHIVFTPKYRRKIIYNQYKESIRDIIKQLCAYKGIEILEGHLIPGHIHMLVSIPPKLSVSQFMGYLKGKKRDGLLSMVTDCERGKIDFVITKSISRFARNTTDRLELVRKLLDLNIAIFFEKENLNTGSMESELMLSILSSLAESESVSISENEKWGIKKRFQNGTFIISYPPYGYDNVDGEMVIVPEQAEVVKQIFVDTLGGKSTHAIANELNKKGIQTKKGGRWTPGTINGIIGNEKYTGDVLYQKTYTDSSFNRHTNYRELDQYLVQNHHPAIISHEEYDRANAVLQ